MIIDRIPDAGASLQTVWNRVGARAEQLAAEVAGGGVDDGSFVRTVVELESLRLQAAASGVVFTTLNELASDILSRPRK